MVTFRNNINNRRPPFKSYNNNRRSPFRRNDEGSGFTNNKFQRNIPGRNNHNASKLIEKYNDLAREALSNEDKILSENYFQHADHFLRIIEDKNRNLNQNKNNGNAEKIIPSDKELPNTSTLVQENAAKEKE